MPDVADINETIAQTAADGIASVTVAGQTTTVLPISDQVKAANHVGAQNATSQPHFGLRFTRLIPGSSKS